MRVVVTGAGGFIGSHVARALLAHGDQVFGLVRPGSNPVRLRDIQDRVTIVRQDLDEVWDLAELLKQLRPEACIHLAWYAEPGKYLHAVSQNLACVDTTLKLVQRLIEVGCRRFVGAGTCIELDTDAGYLTTATPAKPGTIYAASKHATHLLAGQLCAGSPMSFAWVRIFYQFGPYEDERRFVPQVINCLLRGQRVDLTVGEQARDYLHVADVARAFVTVLHSEVTGAVNVGSGKAVTVRHMATLIGGAIGRPDLLVFGGRPTPSSEPGVICADPRPLCSLGWAPTIDLEKGLQDTIAWWSSRLATREQVLV